MPRRRTIWGRAAVSLMLPVALLAGCAEDDDSSSSTDADLRGKVVTIAGPEVEIEAQGLLDSFKPFEDRTGIDVQYQGDRSFEQQIGSRVDGGNAPDVAMFPQPGKVKDFQDDLKALPANVMEGVDKNFDAGWSDLVTFDNKTYGVPVKADLKSLVWYSPKAFKDAGYTIPTTFDDFLKLADKMVADGKTAFCIGIGSDAATGWPATDWVEDFMLRMKGPDVYDDWVEHKIPFDNKDVVEVGQAVQTLWSKPGMVYGGVKNIAATPFADAGVPLLENKCMMHRQGNFYRANWPEGTTFGAEGKVNAFYLPGTSKFGKTTLSGGIYASAFADRPEVMATMEYIASTEFANTRASKAGFLSPNKNTDRTKYPDELTRTFATILAEADPVRFDASDLMPGAVGAGSFWTAEVEITTGAKDVATAYKSVEASWPKS